MGILVRWMLVALVVGIPPYLPATGWEAGVGKADITGPAAEQGMMGYGALFQDTTGIHTRLYARAFWFHEPQSGKSLGIIVADLAMISDLIKGEMIKRLPQYGLSDLSDENLLLLATHTHSGPGGYMPYTLYNLTTYGISQKNVMTIVEGMLRALQAAHQTRKSARILFDQSPLLESSINRNPIAFAQNNELQRPTRDPLLFQLLQEKRNPLMSLLKMEEVDSTQSIGALNWFAVHPTSITHSNHLISSDNKGLASLWMEREGQKQNPGFVSGFANEAEGDVSPNFFTRERTSLSEFDKNRIVADKQYMHATRLLQTATETVPSILASRSVWVKMPGFLIDKAFTGTTDTRLCQAALGLSFAAGATLDGPSGVPGFYEGMKKGDPFRWSTLPFIHKLFSPLISSPAQAACHGAKPVLLTTGMAPYRWGAWTAEKLPFQLHRIGSLAIVAAPAEISTMAGYRLRQQVGEILRPLGVEHVVVSGLANSYSGYVTTFEEYQTQYYAGAHTLYGPHTFAAYLQIFTQLALSMANQGPTVHTEPAPIWNLASFSDFRPGVVLDRPGTKHTFGDVLQQPKPRYHRGETAQAIFVTGHPKNDYRIEDSFLVIQQYQDNKWVSILFDSDDRTRYEWSRRSGSGCFHACSKATISWEIPLSMPQGQYRIAHRGNYKPALRRVVFPLEGSSQSFTVE